jgi:hypothetical protein
VTWQVDGDDFEIALKFAGKIFPDLERFEEAMQEYYRGSVARGAKMNFFSLK